MDISVQLLSVIAEGHKVTAVKCLIAWGYAGETDDCFRSGFDTNSPRPKQTNFRKWH